MYIEIFGVPYLANGSGIHIKKENRGKFTETKKITGKTTEELTHSKNPLTRKRAIFALNAKKWKHEDGGSVHKPNGHRSILDNGWFKTKDLKKNHPLTYLQGGGITNKALELSKAASKAYSEFSDSPWNTVYDIVNTGLYAAAPFTGGVTLVPAMAMSIGLGIAAANNAVNEGVTLNNGLDMAGAVLAAPAKSVMKPLMKAVGKNTKLVKNAKLFKTVKESHKVGNINLGKTHLSLMSLAKGDKKYAPLFGYAIAVPAVGNALIINDVQDNYETYVAPWIAFKQQLKESVNKETNKRK